MFRRLLVWFVVAVVVGVAFMWGYTLRYVATFDGPAATEPEIHFRDHRPTPGGLSGLAPVAQPNVTGDRTPVATGGSSRNDYTVNYNQGFEDSYVGDQVATP